MGETGADVIVMGGGFAGMIAAARLGELGRTAVVLEKGEAAAYACNSRFTGGAMHICFRDPTSAPEVLRGAIEAATAGAASPAMVEAVAQNAGRLIAWLRGQGVGFARGGAEEYKRWVLTPLRPQRRGNIWQGVGGDVVLRKLEAKVTAQGGRLVRGAKVESATRTATGWRVGTVDGQVFTAPALVIADGGFQGNLEELGRHISPKPGDVLQRGAASGCGDGMRLAVSLGAATVGLGRFYGHVMTAEALGREDLWPYPWMDPIAAAGVVVDGAGKRFVDEAEGGVFIANAIARQAEPLGNWAIFDEAIWTGPGAAGVIPPNPNLVLAGAKMFEAGSVAALAAAIGLPVAAVEQTVREHNEALARGTGGALSPPRGKGPAVALPVAKAPFRAVRLAAGITYTMGGIAIDGASRVLDAAGAVVAGLYAAGTATGGLEGGPHGGYVGGLAKSGVTALLAAEAIAAG